jgi:predicted nuclease with TOPRIM domain
MAYPVEEFRKLREAYEDSFHRLSSQVRHFQGLISRDGSNNTELEAARDRLERAEVIYRESRDTLARFMLVH